MSDTLTVRFGRLPKFRVEQLNGSLESSMNLVGNILVRGAVEEIDRAGRIDRGDLRKSINYQVNREETRIVCRVGTNIKYGVFVHEGTRPHYPPLLPIQRWVYRKHPELRGKKKIILGIARAVVKKIGKFGTEATPFLTNSLKNNRVKVQQVIKHGVDRSIGDLFNAN